MNSDPPPPYSATTSDVAYHHEETYYQPPPSNTYQNEIPSSSSYQQQRDLPNYTTQPQPTFSQKFNMQTISQNFQYNPNRGLIGNAFSLAGTIVGTATNTGYGATAGANNNTRSNYAATTRDTPGATLNMVTNLVQSRIDAKQMKKAAKREAKQERRDAKHERREMKRSGDVLNVSRSHNHIEINQSFMGSECRLQTMNGHIQVHGSVSVSNDVSLKTPNGNIVVDGDLSAGQHISVDAANGSFVVNGQSIMARSIQVSTTGPLHFNHNFMEADVVQLRTRNAPVTLAHVSVGSQLSVTTSNAAVEVRVEEITHATAILDIETNNAPVSVYLPMSFMGRFSVISTTQASVVCKSNMMQYNINKAHEKEGMIIGGNPNIQVRIRTSNAPATLYI